MGCFEIEHVAIDTRFHCYIERRAKNRRISIPSFALVFSGIYRGIVIEDSIIKINNVRVSPQTVRPAKTGKVRRLQPQKEEPTRVSEMARPGALSFNPVALRFRVLVGNRKQHQGQPPSVSRQQNLYCYVGRY